MTGGEIVNPLDKPSTNSLIPLLGVRWAWGVTELTAVGLLSLCWLWLSYLPLAPGELWSQLTTANRFPLLDGVPGAGQHFATSQLLQIVTSRFGLEGLASLLASIGMLASLVLYATMFRIHGRPLLAAVSVTLLTATISFAAPKFQVSTFGYLSFAMILHVVCTSTPRTQKQRLLELLLVAFAMTLWTNSSHSFVIGLLLLVSAVRGTGYAALCESGSLRAIWSDSRFRHSVYLLEVGFLAMLLNPLGINALLHSDYLERILTPYASRTWQPLTLTSPAGIVAAVLLVLTLWLFRTSSAKLNPAPVVAWIVTLGLTWIDQSALIWSVPLTLLVLQPLLAERLSTRWPNASAPPQKKQDELTAADFRLTLVSLLVIWIAFTFSPLGSRALGGKGRDESRIVATSIPLGLTQFLNQTPPTGQIAHPAPWGDWLASNGPDNLQLFVGIADLDVCPQVLHNDLINLLNLADDWEKRADRYRVNTILLDTDRHASSIDKLNEDPNWLKTYEDPLAVAFQRAATIPSRSTRETAGDH